MKTYLWYDFETYGADPKRDRISQFAGIRTDEDFNILEEFNLHCKLNYDYIPNPEACLVTGIYPQIANKDGLSEEELSKKLYEIFTKDNTISIGYNSYKFDDEILRHLFYKTFRNPYKREWANGCGRWDFLRGILGFYFKDSESIYFPKDKDGKPSFKLENLSIGNNIIHENAHDALSDVKATIELAKLLKEKNKELFEYLFSLKDKNEVTKLLNRGKYFFHVDFSYGYENNYTTLLYKVDYSFNKNEFLFLDLSSDLDLLYKENVEEIKKLAFLKKEELELLNKTRPGIKQIKTNSFPLLFPADNVSDYSKEISKAKYIETRLRDKLSEYCKYNKIDNNLDIEIDPYNNFFNFNDEAEFEKMRENPLEFKFTDKRWAHIHEKFLGRNYFDLLKEEEKNNWLLKCYKWLNGFDQRDGYLTFDLVEDKIKALKLEHKDNNEKIEILNKLEEYLLSLKEYLNSIKFKTVGQPLFEITKDNTISKPKKNSSKKKDEIMSGIKNLKLF